MSLLLFDLLLSWPNAPLINTSEVKLLWWRGKNHFMDFLLACLNVCCLNIIIYFAIQCGEKLFIDRKIYLVDWQWTVFEVFWVAPLSITRPELWWSRFYISTHSINITSNQTSEYCISTTTFITFDIHHVSQA